MKNLVFALTLSLSITVFGQYSGGTGTSEDPYLIASQQDLVDLSNAQGDWGKSFSLTNDVDMEGIVLNTIGYGNYPFSGYFIGNNHVISNLTVNERELNSGIGLFGTFKGNVEYLKMKDFTYTESGKSRIGSIAGYMNGGSIKNCSAIGGEITIGGGGWAGGIVGVIWNGTVCTIQDCYSTVAITAGWGSGGVVGSTRGPHIIDRVAYYGNITGNPAVVTIQNDPTNTQKDGIPATNAFFATSTGATDADAVGLDDAQLLLEDSYTTFDFDLTWEINTDSGFAILQDTIPEPELPFAEMMLKRRIASNDSIVWKNFGPGMSGYNEEFFCHPTDTNVMFMGPDMHVAYGTWDNGLSWHTIKDYDGDGMGLERVNDIKFSLQDPDYGVAIERRGKVFETKDRGRTWKQIYFMPHGATSPWYNAHSKMAIHPENDSIWYIGAGGFWDVKGNFRSAANPHYTPRDNYAYGYILKTTDRGKTWSKIATDIDDMLDIGRIHINPNHPDSILIAAGQGLFISPDAGATWNENSNGLPNNLPKDVCAYYDKDTKEYILYLVEQSVYSEANGSIETTGGVFKSTDGGKNWTSITGNLGLDFTVITNSTFRNSYAKAVGYWLGKSSSEISALNYPSHTLPVFRRLVVDPTNKDVLYLVPNQRHDKSFGPGDAWKTEDGGATWKIVTRHGTYWHANSDASYWAEKGMITTPNVEFAHLQASLDESHEASSANRNLAINAIGQVFIGINQQTHRSNDGGESWQQIDDIETSPGSNAWIGRGGSNLPGRFILHETGIPDRKLLCSGEHGLWQNADLGNYSDKDAVAVKQIEGQVHDINGNHGAHSISTVAVHPHNPDIIYILMWRQEHRGKVRRSTDGGKTWHNIATLFDADNGSWESVAHQGSLLIDPVNPDNMYFTAIYKPVGAGTGNGTGVDLTMGEYGIYRSNDGGFNWEVYTDFHDGASVNALAMNPNNPKELYACLNQWNSNDVGGLYKSTDGAVTWTQMNLPSAVKSVNDIFIDKESMDMYISTGCRSCSPEQGGVYKSSDMGASWELFFEAPYVWEFEVSPVNPDIMLTSVPFQYEVDLLNPGIYLSRNGGDSWDKINTGLGNVDKMVDIGLDPYNENIIWSAGWGSGWFKAMLPCDSVNAVSEGGACYEGEEFTLYGMGSLGNQLSYEWIAPDGISLSETNNYKATFSAPDVEENTVFTFTLKVFNDSDRDSIEVSVTVKDVAVESVTVSPSHLELLPDESAQLSASYLPADLPEQELIWSSLNENIATVSSSGEVSAVAVGSAKLIATVLGVSDTCYVTVNPILATSVELTDVQDTLKMIINDGITLSASVYPEETTDKSITWLSENNEIATVSDIGLVNAVAEGETYVVALNEASDLSDTCVIVVSKLVGMENFASEKIKIYPVPTKDGRLHVIGTASEYKYKIKDIRGKMLFSGLTGKKVDVSMLNAGVYFLCLEVGDDEQVLKFVISK